MRDDSIPAPVSPAAPTRPIAPWLHTVAILAVFVTISVLHAHTAASSTLPRISRYTSTMLMEWLLLGSAVGGVFHRRAFFAAAFRNRFRNMGSVIGLSFAVFLAGYAAIVVLSLVVAHTPLAHHRNEAVVLAMLPKSPLEFVFWFAISLTAGICEELVFRGYLLTQFTAWTARPLLAIVLSGLVFGASHLYEGLGAILPIAALGVVYGLVVRRMRGDLRVVILAHFLQDFLVAVFVSASPYLHHRPVAL